MNKFIYNSMFKQFSTQSLSCFVWLLDLWRCFVHIFQSLYKANLKLLQTLQETLYIKYHIAGNFQWNLISKISHFQCNFENTISKYKKNMALLKYLKRVELSADKQIEIVLPKPNDTLSLSMPSSSIAAANSKV